MKRFGPVTLVILVLAAGGIYFGREPISDWYKLRGYTPPAEVAALATRTTLKDDYRRLFYVNRPELADDASFNTHCRDNEYTIVLGCYISGQNGIYLLKVDDERLSGIKEVTAAHELLHAAYERLSGKERDRIDALLSQTYVNLKNTRIRETIDLYRKQDSRVVPSELHSILGTEVRELPEQLEEYYSRYFSNRIKIVEYSEQYEQAFVERRNLAREYKEQIDVMRREIDELVRTLDAMGDELKAQSQEMDRLKSSGRTAEFNAQVDSYNDKLDRYNAEYDRYSALIVRHNDLVQRHNSVAAEEAELVDAIDSRTE